MRLGILGGTFNPIHFGHLRAAEEVRFKCNFDKIIFIPSGNPPLKTSDLIDMSHRYAMTKLATKSNSNFIVSDIEMWRMEKSYTVDTIQRLRNIYSADELFFVLGVDTFLDIPNWQHHDILMSIIDLIIVTRSGFDLSDIMKSPYIISSFPISSREGEMCGKEAPELKLRSERKAIFVQMIQMDISSTKIRELLRKNKSIKYLLPEAVEQYIYDRNLYK